jgi:hypothetical protein
MPRNAGSLGWSGVDGACKITAHAIARTTLLLTANRGLWARKKLQTARGARGRMRQRACRTPLQAKEDGRTKLTSLTALTRSKRVMYGLTFASTCAHVSRDPGGERAEVRYRQHHPK